MSISYLQYVSMSVYDAEKFAAWLNERFQESHFKSFADVASKINTTRATISRYATASKQGLTGKASQPRAELVIALANLFDTDVNEALLIAGHAPRSLNELPEPLKVSDFDGFDKEDLEDIAKYILFKKYQKAKKEQR